MNYPWRISLQFEKSPWKLLSIGSAKQTEVAHSCSDIRLISSSLFMWARGIEVCLADRPASHQKPGFAIKRNAQPCLSLQVTRTDEGPYKIRMRLAAVCGWRLGVVISSEIYRSEIYRSSRWGSRYKIRLDAIEVNQASAQPIPSGTV